LAFSRAVASFTDAAPFAGLRGNRLVDVPEGPEVLIAGLLGSGGLTVLVFSWPLGLKRWANLEPLAAALSVWPVEDLEIGDSSLIVASLDDPSDWARLS
jgi:hypothetical protein